MSEESKDYSCGGAEDGDQDQGTNVGGCGPLPTVSSSSNLPAGHNKSYLSVIQQSTGRRRHSWVYGTPGYFYLHLILHDMICSI